MNSLGEQSKTHTIELEILYILSMRIYRYNVYENVCDTGKVPHKTSHKAWAIFEPGEITFYFVDYDC